MKFLMRIHDALKGFEALEFLPLFLIRLYLFYVLWFAGINYKYFIYTILGFVISLPFVIAFLKPYQKLRVLTFLNPDTVF